MPKKVHSINKFGGLVINSDPRDIGTENLSDATNILVDKVGKIRVGRNMTSFSTIAQSLGGTSAGYGLFQFSADYAFGASPALIATNYLAVQIDNEFAIIKSYDGTPTRYTVDAASTTLSLGTDATAVKPHYYYTNGALRISDGNFAHTVNVPKWLGYISRTHFSGLTPGGAADTYTGWYLQNQAITAPTTDTGDTYPSAGNINIYVTSVNTGATTGSWEEGRYLFGASFIYDDNQESKITEFEADGGGLGWSIDNVGEYFSFMFKTTSPLNSRLTGVNVYARNFDTSGEWIQCYYVNLTDGIGLPNSDVTIDFAEESVSSVNIKSDGVIDVLEPSAITYEMSAGFREDEETIYAKYKTSCIINRRCYIGNVQVGGITYGDRMIKSPYNQFDTFPASSFVDAAINDGDEIIALVALSDKIFQFKKKNLYIINVADDYEFIEDTYQNKGIAHPAHVCKVDNGIAWCNSNGVYLYMDGKLSEISNAIMEETTNIVSFDGWIDWFGASSASPVIGFDSVQQKLIIAKSMDDSATGAEAYVLDLRTQSWTYSTNMLASLAENDLRTNAINDANGIYLIGHFDNSESEIYLRKLNTTAVIGSSLSIKTADLVLDDIGIKKRIYNVKMTYRGTVAESGSISCDVKFYKDGVHGTAISTTPTTIAQTSGRWSTATFTPTIFDAYSVLVDITVETTPADFEINDITITYRPVSIQ